MQNYEGCYVRETRYGIVKDVTYKQKRNKNAIMEKKMFKYIANVIVKKEKEICHVS